MGGWCVKYSVLDGESPATYGTAAGGTERLRGCSLDICGSHHTKFIIQSGTHYTEVQSLNNKVSTRHKKRLPEVCRHGDHYFARFYYEDWMSTEPSATRTEVERFYIIKGNSCIELKSLSCERPLRIFDLRRECRGGSHYLANQAGFYIIYSQDNTYIRVLDMRENGFVNMFENSYDSLNTSENGYHSPVRYRLHESFANGLYYFATYHHFYVVKEHAEFGLVYYRANDLETGANMVTVNPSIASIVHCSASLNRPSTTKVSGSTTLNSKEASSQPISAGVTSEVSESDNLIAAPNSGNLTVIKWKNEVGEVKTFHLKASIVHKWREIGDHVAPWEKLEVWAQEKDAEACCKEVLSYWLNNPPPNYPATWEGLYELLVDCELGQVAANLKQAVENST